MEIVKYIQDKIRQQNEACHRAIKLEREIDNWCNLSGIEIYSEEYKETKGKLADAVSLIDGKRLTEIVDKI